MYVDRDFLLLKVVTTNNTNNNLCVWIKSKIQNYCPQPLTANSKGVFQSVYTLGFLCYDQKRIHTKRTLNKS